MAYYRKRYVSRRRARRTLSNYGIATRTSAKAQSRQIYALKRRMNYIQRLNKPEIKLIHHYSGETLNFNAQGISEVIKPLLIDNRVVDDAPASLPISQVIDGKFARLNSMTVTLSYRYEGAGIVQSDTLQRLPQPIYLRMVFYQLKTSRDAGVTTSDIIDLHDGFSRTRGPLADGSARIVKILADKKYMINYNGQTVNRVVRFNYLRNYYKPTNEAFPKGDVRVIIQAWNPSSSVTDATTNVILTFNVKTAYTDA